MDAPANALLQEALRLHRQGALDEAKRGYDQVLKADPANADAHYYLVVISFQQNQIGEVLDRAAKALALHPRDARMHRLLGEAQARIGRRAEALTSFERAIAYAPDMAQAHEAQADVLVELGRRAEAIASYDRALVLQPASISAWCNRGAALDDLGRHKEAIDCYDRVVALKPDFAEAYFNRGGALVRLMRYDEALASYEKAVAVRPNFAEAFNDHGNTLGKLDRHAESIASYDKALAINPNLASALLNRGNALKKLGRLDEALASYDRALSVRPDYAEALFNRANTLIGPKRLEEALVGYERVLTVQPNHAHAFSAAADCVIKICDWDRRARYSKEIIAHVSGKKSIISPFGLIGYSGDPALQLQCAKTFFENQVPALPKPLWTGGTWRHDKLRIAYLSADFDQHPTAYLMAELFELHDRSRFEIIGISFGPDDHSEMRKRLIAAFDQFHDVRSKTDEEIAKLLHDLQVDLAIDLKGYTQDARLGILTYRPAPIQVSFLGFPATMGTELVDYIIADETVAPFEHQKFYAEKIVHLPDCYQVNDTKRKIAASTPTRQDMGLPAQKFVFCCFNNNWKITPEIFDIWMRLLKAVEGSVLWLLQDNESAGRNLRKEAQRRGIDPSRLVFAGRLSLEEHLARHRLADLFLDTLPCNAHTTASDALWVGLPVLTCRGEAFAGRVAASLLHAVGLSEMVTDNLRDYEALALKLACDPAMLAGIKAKLARNRDSYPLFDTDRFTRHIEAAYTTMWEIWQRGEKPKSFAVEPIEAPQRLGTAT